MKILPILTLSLASCASLVTGTTDTVEVHSTPPGAAYETNTGHKGTTPATITISDRAVLEVRYSLEGYEEAVVVSEPKGSAWILGNIIFGGIPGFLIDAFSGNYYVHDKQVTVRLVPVDASEPPLPQ